MKARLYETYDVMLDFGRAASIEDVYRVLLARAARYGASSVLAGIIPKTIIKPEDQPKYVVLAIGRKSGRRATLNGNTFVMTPPSSTAPHRSRRSPGRIYRP